MLKLLAFYPCSSSPIISLLQKSSWVFPWGACPSVPSMLSHSTIVCTKQSKNYLSEKIVSCFIPLEIMFCVNCIILYFFITIPGLLTGCTSRRCVLPLFSNVGSIFWHIDFILSDSICTFQRFIKCIESIMMVCFYVHPVSNAIFIQSRLSERTKNLEQKSPLEIKLQKLSKLIN